MSKSKFRVYKNKVEKIVRSKPDYIKKCICLENGFVHVTKKLEHLVYKLSEGIIDGETYIFEKEKILNDFDFEYTDEYAYESKKILRADYQRRNRLKERITSMLSLGQCLFLTFTFTDEVLEKTQPHIRRKYVQRFLKENCCQYVANIDYGDTTEREHYHAVVLCDYLEYNKWPYGFSYVEKITRYASNEKLACYISKLTNHAIKESVKRCSLIYSRSD